MWHPHPTAFTNKVFSGSVAVASTYQDLDLSAFIGSADHYLVKLVAVVTSAHTPFISVRPKGNSNDFRINAAFSSGVQSGYPTQNEAVAFDVITDENSVIQWSASSAAASIDVYLVGWVDVTHNNSKGVVPDTSGTIPAAAWPGNTLDLSGVVGFEAALVLVEYQRTGGFVGDIGAVRDTDETDDLLSDSGGSQSSGGCSRWLHNAAGDSYGLLLSTGSSGKLQHRRSTTNITIDAYVHAFVSAAGGWNKVNTVHSSGVTPPKVWTDLDLSAIVGSQEAFGILKVTRSAGGAGILQQFATRQKDAANTFEYLLASQNRQGGSSVGCVDASTAIYLEFSTDVNGVTQWISDTDSYTVDLEVVGFIIGNPAPTITNESPLGSDESALATVSFDTNDDTLVDSTTIDLDLTDPSAVVHNAIVNGVFQPGYGGTIQPNGTNGFDVRLTYHPLFDVGAWQADAYCEDVPGKSASSTWAFTVGSFAIVNGWQSSLNTVDIEFDEEPRFLDPVDPIDAINPANYVVSGSPSPDRQIQAIVRVDDVTIRLCFDGELVVGEPYSFDVSGIVSESGHPLSPSPTTFSFVAYGPDVEPIPIEQQVGQAWDIRNPQTERDAPTDSALGTFVIDNDGDLGVETERAYLRKRVFRRISTEKGSMSHEPDYGVTIKKGALYRSQDLRKLQVDIENQVLAEPGVVAARVIVSQLTDGVIYCQMKIEDRFGSFDATGSIGGV